MIDEASNEPIESQITKNGITMPCAQCGHHAPVRMKQGKRHWIRCFMCQVDGQEADDMEMAIAMWEYDNAQPVPVPKEQIKAMVRYAVDNGRKYVVRTTH